MKKELEKDIDTLKRDIEDTKQTRDQLQNELELVKDEVERLEADHKKVRLSLLGSAVLFLILV